MPARLRNAVSAALLALACLCLPFGALAAWAAYGLADTGRYVTAMAPLSADPAVREAVVAEVGAGILREAGDRSGHGADAGRLRPFVFDAVRSFTRTEAFRTAWDATNRTVHDAVLRALRDERPGARPVTVDLAPVAARVTHRLARDHPPLAYVPVEHTEVRVLPAREVAGLRKGYHVLDTAAFWLPLATVVLAVAGIAVAACRRRAVTATGLGTALGGALLVLAIAIGRRLTLAGLPDEVHPSAVGAVYDALTATLRTASWLLCALGLTVACTAWLTTRYGPPARHRRARAEPTADPPPKPTRAQA
ncbi:hypothetical protein [Streptomyces bullii]|uniref:Integral membrane protein n=1 Tax=Streptomyces bullii TaxID=349910 RepID=A0ABW0UKF7_9ACTN